MTVPHAFCLGIDLSCTYGSAVSSKTSWQLDQGMIFSCRVGILSCFVVFGVVRAGFMENCIFVFASWRGVWK